MWSSWYYLIPKGLTPASTLAYVRRTYTANSLQKKPLENTLTLVSGGTRGIGLATAKLFALNGSRVVILGRDQHNVNHVVKTELDPIPSSLGPHLGLRCDVSRNDDIENVIKELAKVAPVDHLVMSAGIGLSSLLIGHNMQDLDNVIQTNLMGTIWFNKAVAKGMMKRKKGAIINISSVVGIQGTVGQSAYAASKAGVIGFTKTLSRELGSKGVTVNAIAPGYIETNMTENFSEDHKKQLLSRIALARFGRPEEVAEAALYLAQAKYVTGQVLVVDGGMAL
ncbi:hypothetical protein BGZ76_010311 [Entomortierella beljakovae]|nr:hypothetical protein BGZ76_010311 [Entomortierella beljakovae]